MCPLISTWNCPISSYGGQSSDHVLPDQLADRWHDEERRDGEEACLEFAGVPTIAGAPLFINIPALLLVAGLSHRTIGSRVSGLQRRCNVRLPCNHARNCLPRHRSEGLELGNADVLHA
jgi:hypothetical protein